MSSSQSGRPYGLLRLVSGEFDQVLRLQAFRATYPDVVIGDGGFGTIQARIPEPNGEVVITRYRLAELLDRLDELMARPWGTTGVDPAARELAQLVAAAGQGGGLGGVACQLDGLVVRGA
jgi:hypothetical protein